MENSALDNLIAENFADEIKEFAEIDFSSLLDEPTLSPAVSSRTKLEIPDHEKYLTFYLDEKLYGIRAGRVLEVISFPAITPLLNVPEWLLGIANLRGTIISVVDLRQLWEKPAHSLQKSRLIVFQFGKNDTPIAFVVDKLSEIITIAQTEIKFSAADFEHSFPTFFGKTEFKSQSLFLLDIDRILSSLSLENSPAN